MMTPMSLELLASESFWMWLAAAITALVIVVVVAWVVSAVASFSYGDGATRARRRAAILIGPLEAGVPFSLSGVGAGTKLALRLDADFSVPWEDILATLDRSGIWLDYELTVAGQRYVGGRHKLPQDRMPRNAKGEPELHEVSIGAGGGRTRFTSVIAWIEVPAGVAVAVRGEVTALPETTVRSLSLWVG
jgi:hypothetical protein